MSKKAFTEFKLNTPEFSKDINLNNIKKLIENEEFKYPIILKSIYGSKNKGNTFIQKVEDLEEWFKTHNNYSNYILEQYINYSKEYRIHVSINGIFSIFRKLRKNNSEQRWYFNSENSIFKIITKEEFEKHPCYEELNTQLVEATKALQLEIVSFDVRINKDYSKFTIIESNSAPSLNKLGTMQYFKEIIEIVIQKIYEKRNNINRN